MNFSQLANKLRYKITKFSGILSKGLDKTARRFIQEAIYGIIASESVMLTEIGRQLQSGVSLKKTEERFSRQLIKPMIWSCLQQNILSLSSERVKERTLLILDLSDLKKPYAEKMEYLARVRNGSAGGEIVDGYWTKQVIASEVGRDEITPLYYSLYSQRSPDFESENVEIIKTFNQVGKAVGNRGIWVIDRGGDRDDLYSSLLKNKKDFIIRLVGLRDLVYEGKASRSLWLAYACRLPYENTIIRVMEGKEARFNIRYGSMPVYLPGFKNPLTMVVVKGFSGQPMILLTSIRTNSPKDLWFIISAYMKRWSIEETIRFVKQTYDLENIRVLKYVRLQNMMAVLLAVFYFVSVILDQSQKLTVMAGHVLKYAKRVFGIPDFKYYAIGDGLSNIFSRYPGKLLKCIEIDKNQLSFGFG
jgi:hypothetical protein